MAGKPDKPAPTHPPAWVTPQLAKLVDKIPAGNGWAHEVKFDGYRIMARLEDGAVQLLTRSGLDWSDKYPAIARDLSRLKVANAYIDGELCALRADGTTSLADMQAAAEGRAALVYFAFDLLFLDGRDLVKQRLLVRKEALRKALTGAPLAIAFSDCHVGEGPKLYAAAKGKPIEGFVSKRVDAAYSPGDRGLWVKTKFLNEQAFVIVGWSEPEGARAGLGALLLGYYADDGKLIYAGRAGTGMSMGVLLELLARLKPLEQKAMTVDKAPPKDSRFGRPLQLSKVHWVRPELVAAVTFLSWTDDGLLRQVVFQGLREDKPAREVHRQG